MQLATLQALARYWATEYSWRRCEARLNALPQFTTDIDGVEIHFIHVRSRHENAMPLIMTHGWPGSVVELLDSIGPLTDPTAHGGTADDAFHLVMPSLPGYGLSGEPTELGWENGRIARAWAELMHRLDYDHYVAQGGDVGAAVTDAMGREAPEGCSASTQPAALAIARRTSCRRSPTGTRGAREARPLHDGRLRLLPRASHPPANDRLLPVGLTDGAGGLDARPRHRQLPEDLPRVRRRGADGQSDPGPHPRQHHAVLAYGHWGLGRTLVLGVRTIPRRGRNRPANSPRRSRFRLASPSSPAKSGRPRGAGSSRRIPALAYFNEAADGAATRGLGRTRIFATEMRAAFQLTALTQPSTSLHTPRHGLVRPGARGLARKLVLGSPGPQLEAAGHRVTTVDLPAEDPDATFETYAQAVADAIPDDDTTVVGHSLSGLTIPLVAAHRRVRGLVYLCGLVPIPGLSVMEQLEREPDMLGAGYTDGLGEPDENGCQGWEDLDLARRFMYADCSDEDGDLALARRGARRSSPSVCPAP